MRAKIIFILVCCLCALKSFAASPTNVNEFLKLSEEMRGKAKTAKDFKGKALELQKLESEFVKVRADLKKKFPDKGPPEEKPINVFFYTLEPVFQIAQKKSAPDKDCDEAERQIKADDRQGKKESDPVDKDTAEALAWLSLLCD